MNSARQTYKCRDCGVTVIIPLTLQPLCPHCDGELESAPDVTMNLGVSQDAAERVKRLTVIRELYQSGYYKEAWR